MTFENRIGVFFTLLGLALIGLFILSDIAKTPSCGFLIIGTVLLALGIFMSLHDPVKPGPPPERFRLLRKKQLDKKK